MRGVGASIGEGERTHVERLPIDVERARAQHAEYVAALESLGCEIVALPAAPAWPDAVFVEDTIVVFDETAVAARPGAESRRVEVPSVVRVVEDDRSVVAIESPGTLDGGDVLTIGRTVWVGRTSRTNDDGIRQLIEIVQPHGYDVRPIEVGGCLHLKSAATPIGERAVVVQPAWVDRSAFGGLTIVEVDPDEPEAANVLSIGVTVLVADGFPRTADRIASAGYEVRTIASDELAKAEGGLTCCSVIYRSSVRTF